MMCLSSTLFPVPEGPSSATVSPSLHVEVDAVEDDLLAEPLVHAAELDHVS